MAQLRRSTAMATANSARAGGGADSHLGARLVARSGCLAVLLVFVKLLDGIALLAFWVALGDMITGRQAKRLFAPLAAGITIGRLIGSFGTEPASRVAGIEGLVLFAGGLYALAAAAALFLRRTGKIEGAT